MDLEHAAAANNGADSRTPTADEQGTDRVDRRIKKDDDQQPEDTPIEKGWGLNYGDFYGE